VVKKQSIVRGIYNGGHIIRNPHNRKRQIENISLSEKDFIDYLNSITFVDKDGNVLPTVLSEDDSDDPENDRG